MIERRPRSVARCSAPDDVVAALAFARADGLPSPCAPAGTPSRARRLSTTASCSTCAACPTSRSTPTRRIARVGGGATWAAGRPRHAGARARHHRRPRLDHRRRRADPGRRLGLARAQARPGLRQPRSRPSWSPPTASSSAPRRREPGAALGAAGGGGNFGVVTALEFRLHPVGPEVLAGLVLHPADARPRAAARASATSCATRPTSSASRSPTSRRRPRTASPRSCTAGRRSSSPACTPARSRRASGRSRALRALGPPAADFFAPTPYADFQCSLDDPPGYRNYWTAEHVARPRRRGAIDVIAARSERIPAGPVAAVHRRVGRSGRARRRRPLAARRAATRASSSTRCCLWEDAGRRRA